MYLAGMGIVITLIRTRLVVEESLSPVLLLPMVGMATDAVVGAAICNSAYELSPRLAVPVIITSYLLGGFAIWFSVIMYGLFFYQMLTTGYPAPAKLPTLFVLVLTSSVLPSTMKANICLGWSVRTDKHSAGIALIRRSEQNGLRRLHARHFLDCSGSTKCRRRQHCLRTPIDWT